MCVFDACTHTSSPPHYAISSQPLLTVPRVREDLIFYRCESSIVCFLNYNTGKTKQSFFPPVRSLTPILSCRLLPGSLVIGQRVVLDHMPGDILYIPFPSPTPCCETATSSSLWECVGLPSLYAIITYVNDVKLCPGLKSTVYGFMLTWGRACCFLLKARSGFEKPL